MIRYEDYAKFFSPVLSKSSDVVAVEGKGCYIKDVKGDVYLDFVQGIAVNALGHCFPPIVEAICRQARKLVNASFNMVSYESTLRLAERLAAAAPGNLGSILFSNGGAEATDGALKLAKVYTKRPAIIAFMGSFHGRADRSCKHYCIQRQIQEICGTLNGKRLFFPLSQPGSVSKRIRCSGPGPVLPG